MLESLFESPRPLLAIAIALEAVLMLAWLLTHSKVRPHWLLVGPIVAGAAFLLDGLVETNREQLDRTTRLIVQAAEDENAPLLIAQLSDNLSLENGLGKHGVSTYLNDVLSKPLIATNMINEIQVVEVEDNHGRVEFSVTTNIDHRSDLALVRLIRTQWQFDYIRDPDGVYRLRNLEMLSYNNSRPFDIFAAARGRP